MLLVLPLIAAVMTLLGGLLALGAGLIRLRLTGRLSRSAGVAGFGMFGQLAAWIMVLGLAVPVYESENATLVGIGIPIALIYVVGTVAYLVVTKQLPDNCLARTGCHLIIVSSATLAACAGVICTMLLLFD